MLRSWVSKELGQRSSNLSVEGFPIIGSQSAIIEWDLMNLIEMASLMCIMDGVNWRLCDHEQSPSQSR